jgi:hypothetical protein
MVDRRLVCRVWMTVVNNDTRGLPETGFKVAWDGPPVLWYFLRWVLVDVFVSVVCSIICQKR